MDAGSADDPGPPPDDAAQPVAVLEELLAAKGEHLLRTAVLLAGSRADGEDLLQAALERLFRRWRTIRGDPEGYLRRTLYHLAADGWRRNGAWRARLRLLGNPATPPRTTAGPAPSGSFPTGWSGGSSAACRGS
jgi:DNA-directed RNA polymerase specialized sigma24 family protein